MKKCYVISLRCPFVGEECEILYQSQNPIHAPCVDLYVLRSCKRCAKRGNSDLYKKPHYRLIFDKVKCLGCSLHLEEMCYGIDATIKPVTIKGVHI